MRILLVPCLAICVAAFSASCNSSKKEEPKAFCETPCDNDTMQFRADIPEKSFVMITMDNCEPDSITWGNQRMDTYRQLAFAELAGKIVKINKDYVKVDITGTSHAWIQFNDCTSGQGFIARLPYNEKENIFRKNSAFNPADPKYKVDASLVAYTDRGNLFVEEKATGKKAMMTFGAQTEMEYDRMHETVESVEVTPTLVRSRVMIDKEWKDLEKKITLE
jgi:hypothetical protein